MLVIPATLATDNGPFKKKKKKKKKKKTWNQIISLFQSESSPFPLFTPVCFFQRPPAGGCAPPRIPSIDDEPSSEEDP